MIATVEQTQTDLLKLVSLVQKGEEVVITSKGQAVARLTAVPRMAPAVDRSAWLSRLADLRNLLSAGKPGPSVEQILDEDRGE